MVMIAHLTPCVAHPIESLAHLPQQFQPRPPIGIAKVNILAPVTA
jgi:hypothetical protein